MSVESTQYLINSARQYTNLEDYKNAMQEALSALNQPAPAAGVESVTGDSVDNTDSANPVVNAIPLAGTETGSPVTGDIEVTAGRRIKTANAAEDGFNSFYLDDGGVQMQADLGGGDTQSASLGGSGFAVSNSYNSAPMITDNGQYLSSIYGDNVDPLLSPERVGAIWINTSSIKIFISVSTSDVSDWKQIFPALP